MFHIFVHIFDLDPALNMPFFEKITNQILRLNYAQLFANPWEAKTKDCAGSRSIQHRLQHCSRF